MDAQEQEQDSGPLTVVLGCWTLVLEQVPPEGGGGHPTLKVDVRLGKGLGQASPAQVRSPSFVHVLLLLLCQPTLAPLLEFLPGLVQASRRRR